MAAFAAIGRIEVHGQNETRHRHVSAGHVYDRVEVFQCFELHLYVAVVFSQLLEHKLPQIFGRCPRLAPCSHAFNRDMHQFVVADTAFEAGKLRIGGDTTRDAVEKGRPVKSVRDHFIQDARSANNAGELRRFSSARP